MGHSPVPLNEHGVNEAKQCALYLLKNFSTISTIYSSTLLRAQETTEIICKHINYSGKINYKDFLTERTFGEFAGLSYQEIDKKLRNSQGIRDVNFRPPGGESAQDFYLRIIQGFNELINAKYWSSDETLLIISHGGTIKHLLGYLIMDKNNKYNIFPVDVKNCSITSLNVFFKSGLESTVNYMNFYQYLST